MLQTTLRQLNLCSCALWEARLFIRPSLKSPGCLRRNGMAYTVYHLPFLNWLRCRDRQKPIIIITCAEVVRQQIIQTHAQECANIPKLLRNCRWNEQSEFLKLSVLHIQITMEPNWQFSANQVNHSWWPPFFEIQDMQILGRPNFCMSWFHLKPGHADIGPI